MVTVLCIVIAVPFAYFMARVAPRRLRHAARGCGAGAAVGLATSSRPMPGGRWCSPVASSTAPSERLPGTASTAVVLTLTYLWLPYMILPVYAGFERLPESHLEASADLGAKGLHTFRRVILPALLPSIAAGTVFTFSLSLGDYIAVQIVGGTTAGARHHGSAEHHARPALRGGPGHDVGA